jgi:hypothetical protein
MDAQQCIDTRKLAMHLLKISLVDCTTPQASTAFRSRPRHLGEFLEKILQP